jgi:hypothetical protein
MSTKVQNKVQNKDKINEETKLGEVKKPGITGHQE